MLEWGLEMIEQGCGRNDYRVAVAANNLAVLFQSMSPPVCTTPHPKLKKAQQLLQRSLIITQDTYGGTHTEVAQRLNNLVMLLRSQSKLQEATPLMEQAVKITEAAVERGEESQSKFGARLDNLGRLYLDQGRLANAEPVLLQALSALDSCMPDSTQEVRYCLHNLVRLYGAQENSKRAAECQQRVTDMDYGVRVEAPPSIDALLVS